jgi:hypothetical protein
VGPTGPSASVRLTRRKDAGRYVVEDEAGGPVATCTYRVGVLRRLEADRLAYRIRGRWLRVGAFDAIDVTDGGTVLTLRQTTIALADGRSFRCQVTDRDGGPRPHRAAEARMVLIESTAGAVMTLQWDGPSARHGTSTSTFDHGTALVDAACLAPHVGLVTAVAFHVFSTRRLSG